MLKKMDAFQWRNRLVRGPWTNLLWVPWLNKLGVVLLDRSKTICNSVFCGHPSPGQAIFKQKTLGWFSWTGQKIIIATLSFAGTLLLHRSFFQAKKLPQRLLRGPWELGSHWTLSK